MKTRYSMGSCLVVGMLCAVSPWWGHFFPTSAAGDDRLSWQAERVTVGAIRWDAWFSDPHNPYVKNLSAHKWHHRLPFYAEIISDSEVRIQNDVQEVVDREIAYARQGGIDYWAFLYYQPTVRKDGFDHDAMNRARRLFLSSKHKNDIHFCLIVYPNHGGMLADAHDPDDEIIHEWMDMMREPNYQTVVGGRPLLYVMFWSLTASQTFGSVEKGRDWMDALRTRAIRAGVKNPYLVALSLRPEEGARALTETGLDAISSYTAWGGPDYAGIRAAHLKHWDGLKATGKKVIPNLSAGWGGPRDGLGDARQPKSGELAAHLRDALDWIQANPDAAEAKTTLWYAWNEMDEGGWLVPDKCLGTAKLDEIRAVLDERSRP